MITPTSKTDGGQLNQDAVTNTNKNTVMCRVKQSIDLKYNISTTTNQSKSKQTNTQPR